MPSWRKVSQHRAETSKQAEKTNDRFGCRIALQRASKVATRSSRNKLRSSRHTAHRIALGLSGPEAEAGQLREPEKHWFVFDVVLAQRTAQEEERDKALAAPKEHRPRC